MDKILLLSCHTFVCGSILKNKHELNISFLGKKVVLECAQKHKKNIGAQSQPYMLNGFNGLVLVHRTLVFETGGCGFKTQHTQGRFFIFRKLFPSEKSYRES